MVNIKEKELSQSQPRPLYVNEPLATSYLIKLADKRIPKLNASMMDN